MSGYRKNYNEFNVNGGFTNGWNFYTKGWKTGETMFFHTTGYRSTQLSDSGTGVIISNQIGGNYWTGGAYDNINGYFVYFYATYIHADGALSRSNGFYVQSVLE